MDLLGGNVKRIYLKYLSAAFGSALISSIYSMVDMAVVGWYQGPEGTAALAVVAPVWNILYSLGLLTGIGGSVLSGAARGRGEERQKNEYFTMALLCTILFAAVCWLALLAWEEPMLRLFGGEGELLTLAEAYLRPVKFAVPLFLFSQMLAAFLRNDGHPGLAAAAVLTGGIFNVFGDYFFVFTLDMGILGAGLATAIGALLSCLMMLTHFLTRGNTLGLRLPKRPGEQLRQILLTGFSSFFIDVAMGILTTLFNRQIMRYLGADALAVYGVIVNVSTFVQCCAYSVGQAAQPILSLCFGAGSWGRIRQTLRCALWSAALFGVVWTLLILAFPDVFIRIFMAPTAEICRIGPAILRRYGLSFLLLPLNIFSTYYFQSLMRPMAAFAVSTARGLLILLLPAVLGPDALWFAMPLTEALVAAGVVCLMRRFTGALPAEEN